MLTRQRNARELFQRRRNPATFNFVRSRVLGETICPHDSLFSEQQIIPCCTRAPWDLVREMLPGEIHKPKPRLPKKNVGSWRVRSTFAISVLPSPPSAQLGASRCILKDPVALTTSVEMLFQDFLPILGAPGKQQMPEGISLSVQRSW